MAPPTGLPRYRQRTITTVIQPQRSNSGMALSSSSHANRMITQRKHTKQARNAQIVLYRAYRQGELPDICVPLDDLLRPFLGLSQRDAYIASRLFSVTFESLYTALPPDSHEATNLRLHLLQLISTTASQGGHTQFTATLLGASQFCLGREDPRKNGGYRPKGQHLMVYADTSPVADSALRSLNFHGGRTKEIMSIHPINTLCQYIVSTHPVNTPCQPTCLPASHLHINISYQHTLFTTPRPRSFITPYLSPPLPPLSTHPRHPVSGRVISNCHSYRICTSRGHWGQN